MKAIMTGSAALLLLCGAGTAAAAQETASSFHQLTVLVKPGDTISVVETTGREIVGRIETLSHEGLTLSTRTGIHLLNEAGVATIHQRRSDSLQNGAIIGAAAGAGYGLGLLALAMGSSDGGGPLPVGVVVGMTTLTGIGALSGAGIDALIKRRQVIYDKRGAAGSVSVAPLLLRGGRGIAVSVRF